MVGIKHTHTHTHTHTHIISFYIQHIIALEASKYFLHFTYQNDTILQMQLFGRISNAVIMNLDKHQLYYLLLVPLLLNMTAATHKLKQTQSHCILSFGWFPIFWISFAGVSVHSLSSFFLLTPPTKMGQSVLKRRQIEFRCWEITQKKECNIQNMLKFWYQETWPPSSLSLPICTPQ